MSTKPARPDDDDEDATPYGVAFEAPHVPPPIAYPTDDDDDFAGPAVAPRKKKKRKPRPDGVGEVAEQHRDRLLEREDDPSAALPWWTEAACVACVGVPLTLLAVAVIAYNAERANLAVGLFLLVGVVAAAAVETAAVTAFLVVVGNLFGIDYGPVRQAIPKLVAVIVLVNGVTLLSARMCLPVGLVAGSLVGVPAFWRLFRIGLQETLISVGVMVLASWVLAAALLALAVTKAQGG